jgi:hypothetical protein
MGEALAPFRDQIDHLKTIPGVSDTVAQAIAAEVGFDMSRFPSAGHLVSWAGLCLKMDESAGKRRSTRVRKGAPWLKAMLVTKKAILAVAVSILTAVYHMLRDYHPYRDLGSDHFDQRDKRQVAKHLLKRLGDLGYTVEVSERSRLTRPRTLFLSSRGATGALVLAVAQDVSRDRRADARAV